MSAEIGAANIRVGSTIQGLIDGMKRVSTSVRTTVYDINTRLADSYKRANKEQAVFRGGLMKLGDDLTSIGSKMALVTTLPALFAAGKSFKDYAELQKLEKGLERYGETLANVRDIAKLPNIGVFDGAKSLISLKAMKLNGDLATRSIKAFANAITDAGGSAVDLEPALINLRQFVATKHINQVDLRQLAARMPQTYDAMEAAFKTQDVEKLNEKMKSIGVTAFIEKFIAELEKIPKAGGGAATAMEQFGDSATFASGALGEGFDQAFNVTEKINSLTDRLDAVTDSFKAMSPEAKRSVLALGAVAVAVPVLIGAVGGLIKLWPILTAAFTTVATTVGAPISAILAVGAAIGVAAAAIITNWDSIKKYLTDTTWWNTITGIAGSVLGAVVETFKVVVNLIQGDWGNMWKAIVNLGKNAANLIIETIAGTAKGIVKILGSVQYLPGLGDIGKGVDAAAKGIDGFASKVKFDVPDAFATAGKAVGAVKDAIGGIIKPPKLDPSDEEYYEKMSESAFKIWQIDLAGKWAEEREALKAKIKSYKELIGVTASLTAERLKLSKPDTMRIGNTVEDGRNQAKAYGSALIESRLGGTLQDVNKAIAKAFSGQNARFAAAVDLKQSFGSALDFEQLKSYFSGFQGIVNETKEQYQDKIGAIVDATGRLKEAFGSAFNLESMKSLFQGVPDLMGKTGEQFAERSRAIVDATTKLRQAMGASFSLEDAKKFFIQLPKLAGEAGDKYSQQIGEIAESSARMSAALTSAVQGSAVEAFTTLGEKLGDSMSGLSGIGDKIYVVIGDLLINIGKALVTYNTVIQGLKVAIKSMNGYVALAAGVLAIAAGTVLKNRVSKMGETTRFAKGGFAYGEMTAIVGDNPNARHDPEMIAPYSKVDKSIEKSIKTHGGGGGVQVYIPRLEIENDKFYVAFKRSEVKYKALLGGS